MDQQQLSSWTVQTDWLCPLSAISLLSDKYTVGINTMGSNVTHHINPDDGGRDSLKMLDTNSSLTQLITREDLYQTVSSRN
jgi:hypothetical protein